MMIGKTSEKIKLVKDMIKSISKYPNQTITDDLEVLELAYKFKLEIPLLLYVEQDYKEETKALLDDLIDYSNESYQISDTLYESLKLKENHAGILAVINLKSYSFDDFKNMDFTLVLDRLEIPGNIGTLYRTADSALVKGIILVDPVVKINSIKLTSSARGCNLIIPTLCLTYLEAQEFLLENNYDIYLGEPKLGLDYQSYDYNDKTAIVIGNERYGINNNWYQNKHKKVYIPMQGHENSLNVSVAGSILVYETYMKKYFNK